MDKGVIINQAYDIINQTYKEIKRMKDDISDLLADYDNTLVFDQEYSYGPKTLSLKANHTFVFKSKPEDEGSEEEITRVFAIVCIFYEQWGLNRISLKNQPEVWFASLEIGNLQDTVKPWSVYDLLKADERVHFKDDLRADGNTFKYYWKGEMDENDELVQTIINEGTWISIDNLGDFNYLK